MRNQEFKPLSIARIWLARAIGIGADVIQLVLFQITAEGIASPVADVLDLAVAGILTLLVGWHIAFLPSFLVKLLPIADLAPTWTIAAFIATRNAKSVELAPRMAAE